MRIIVLLLVVLAFVLWGAFFARHNNPQLARILFGAAGVLGALVVLAFFGLL